MLRNYHAYTVEEYKWLDKGMSPSKTKMNYEAYKGPVGEMKVESSFGKLKSWSTSRVSELQHVISESLGPRIVAAAKQSREL